MATQLSPDMLEQLFALRDALAAAPRGEQSARLESFANFIGKSPNTVHRWLKDYAGRKTNRKTRADAGSSCVSDGTLELIAGMQREGVRGNGKKIVPTAVAMNIAHHNGVDIKVSEGQFNRLMRAKRLDVASVVSSRSHIAMRAEHVNQEFQIDPSLCVIFYLQGKQFIMRDEEFYKNKLDNISKIKLKVWRYVRYEKASASIDVRYYEAAGENQQSLFEFCHYTMSRQPHRLSYGRPARLVMDKGSANTSHGILNWMDAMGVEVITHAAGHSWAKGGVEKSNDIVELQFESRLKIEPVESVMQLNASAEQWVRDYNANTIKHVDCRVRRASGEPLVRDDLWQLIMRTPEHLIEIPSIAVCQYFLCGKQDTRQVKSNYTISFVHPELKKSQQYSLAPWAEFLANKMEVKVWALLLKDGALRVEIPRFGAEPLLVEVAAETAFDAFGSPMSATVPGEYSRTPQSLTEANDQRLAKAAYGEDATRDTAEVSRAKQARPFAHLNDGKGLVAHSHLGKEALPQRLLPAATPLVTEQITAATSSRVEFPPLSLVEFSKHMAGDWHKDFAAVVLQRYPDKRIPANEVEALKERLLRGTAAPLRVVGGTK
ncbi:MAG: hypothetical protein PXX73_04715 [Sideroxydans sp.]|nr:hypothetical protein [Sideroxydans sp.]